MQNIEMLGKLGTHVVYLSSNGKRKTALVIGDPSSVEIGEVGGPNDGAVPPLAQNERHLLIFSPTGAVYLKHNVSMVAYDCNPEDNYNHWMAG